MPEDIRKPIREEVEELEKRIKNLEERVTLIEALPPVYQTHYHTVLSLLDKATEFFYQNRYLVSVVILGIALHIMDYFS